MRPTRYVVIELKTDKFQPEYAGKVNFCVALVDGMLRRGTIALAATAVVAHAAKAAAPAPASSAGTAAAAPAASGAASPRVKSVHSPDQDSRRRDPDLGQCKVHTVGAAGLDLPDPACTAGAIDPAVTEGPRLRHLQVRLRTGCLPPRR